MMVTAAPVSTFASIVSLCPVDGFSRLIHTYTCSYGAFNFNRSIIPVFCSTSYNLWLRKTDGPPVGEIDVPKVWDDILFLVHDPLLPPSDEGGAKGGEAEIRGLGSSDSFMGLHLL